MLEGAISLLLALAVVALFAKPLSRFNGHVHCFCDKKRDYEEDGVRVIIMACNKCGLEKEIWM